MFAHQQDLIFIVIGGDSFPEPRYIWWNFVSSSEERIRKATEDWKDQKVGKIEGELDFIPLPNDPLPLQIVSQRCHPRKSQF